MFPKLESFNKQEPLMVSNTDKCDSFAHNYEFDTIDEVIINHLASFKRILYNSFRL